VTGVLVQLHHIRCQPVNGSSLHNLILRIPRFPVISQLSAGYLDVFWEDWPEYGATRCVLCAFSHIL